MNTSRQTISIVVPVKDEVDTLQTLYEGCAESVSELGLGLEMIFIDDGSTDGSWQVMEQLQAAHPESVQALRLRRNCGKALALSAGFKQASGDVVFTMDADLQDDPREIPKFLAKLDEGEVSTALTTADGQALVFLMLCGRTLQINEDANREAVRQNLINQRLASYADGYLSELRSDAVIDRP